VRGKCGHGAAPVTKNACTMNKHKTITHNAIKNQLTKTKDERTIKNKKNKSNTQTVQLLMHVYKKHAINQCENIQDQNKHCRITAK
jgi:hypothetical protein